MARRSRHPPVQTKYEKGFAGALGERGLRVVGRAPGLWILPDVLTRFDHLKKNRALRFDKIEKFWSINMMCGRCEWSYGRIFLPRFLKSCQDVRFCLVCAGMLGERGLG
jgi:hypothetical protein